VEELKASRSGNTEASRSKSQAQAEIQMGNCGAIQSGSLERGKRLIRGDLAGGVCKHSQLESTETVLEIEPETVRNPAQRPTSLDKLTFKGSGKCGNTGNNPKEC
jgi:hypothetical protein